MGEIRISLEDETQLKVDTVDIGTVGDVIVFEIEGKIVGVGESELAQIADKQWVPTEVVFKPKAACERRIEESG